MNTFVILHKASYAKDFLRVAHFTPLRNILLGAGLCFAIQNEKYWHIPAVVVLPSVYTGYQAFKHKDSIAFFIKNTLVQLRSTKSNS